MITSFAAKPVTVADEAVFFAFDDHSIPFTENLTLTLQRGQKHPDNPVVRHGPPGAPDDFGCHLYGTVLQLDGKLRMWYLAIPKEEDGKLYGFMAYAESDDGVRWAKPDLGLVEWKGSRHNNLCLIEPNPEGQLFAALDYISVIHDPEDPDPERRFKTVFQRFGRPTGLRPYGAPVDVDAFTMVTAVSPDGFRWRILDPTRSPVRERFQADGCYKFGGTYYTVGQQLHPYAWLADGSRCGRVMTAFESADFNTWSRGKALALVRPGYESMLPGEGEEVASAAGLWNRGNVLVGTFGLWHGEPGTWPQVWTKAHVDLGLTISNDGLHFREPLPDFAIIPRGGTPEWDSNALLPGYAFASLGDRTYVWYCHWDAMRRGLPHEIGLATFRRDGFGYLARRDLRAEGTLISCPVELDASASLYVNATGLSERAALRVELLDEGFRPIHGYSGSAAASVIGDGTRAPVFWGASPIIEGLRGQRIRVKVSLSGHDPTEAQRLYAIYLAAA